MPRKSICEPCHKLTNCTVPLHMHVKGLKERKCSYCEQIATCCMCPKQPGVFEQTMHPRAKVE